VIINLDCKYPAGIDDSANRTQIIAVLKCGKCTIYQHRIDRDSFALNAECISDSPTANALTVTFFNIDRIVLNSDIEKIEFHVIGLEAIGGIGAVICR
jgi:hypothetical protein